ncbi:DUF2059 domain-containing protein [Hydrogenophaga sp.]|uniref:DUF2059 domain-containing protein n=1 Tax=Hydrogenophaga sp. TaxID=1904254 RepID=UPI0035B0CF29
MVIAAFCKTGMKMTKPLQRMGIGILAICLLAPTTGVTGQTNSAQAVRVGLVSNEWQRLLMVSRIELALLELPAHFKQGLDQAKSQGLPISPEVEVALKAAADEVFGAAALQGAALSHLEASLSPSQLRDWLAFYQSPLGQKMAAADERAASPDFLRSVMDRAPRLMETVSRDTGRLALLQSWLDATGAVEQSTNMALHSQLALEWGLVSTLPRTAGMPTFDELKSYINERRFVVKAHLAQLALLHSAAAYQDFSNEDIRQMLQRANSPAGQALYVNFNRKMHRTLEALVEKVGLTAGRRLASHPT